MNYRSKAVLRLNNVKKITDLWWKNIPYIQPYYAVKSFPNKELIKFLYAEKFKFDCASKNEIKLVKSVCLSKLDDCDILFANPAKSEIDIKYAKYKNVNMVVIDNIDEIKKISSINKKAKYILRVKGYETNSIIKFNNKFGASSAEATDILNYIQSNNLDFLGYSYHVGSQCYNMESHRKTITSLLDLIYYSNMLGLRTKTIDIGGGFDNVTQLKELNNIYNRHFRYILEKNEIRLIAEPGRIISAPSLDVIVKVIAINKKDDIYNITVNDSVYHSFQGKIYDFQSFIPLPLYKGVNVMCNIFGQTCDSLDIICKEVIIPLPTIGDHILFENMGAYSLASSNGKFNGFDSAIIE